MLRRVRFLCLTLCIAIWAPVATGDDLIKPEQNILKPVIIQTQITEITTGWNAEQFGIVTVAPIVGGLMCAKDHDAYATDHDHPGYQTYYAAALLAFAERATVIVVVSNTECVAGRAALIGLNIVR